MAFPKICLLLGLAFAFVVLISSHEVSAARELAEITQTKGTKNNIEEADYGEHPGRGHRHGRGCHGDDRSHDGRGSYGDYPGNGGHGHGDAKPQEAGKN